MASQTGTVVSLPLAATLRGTKPAAAPLPDIDRRVCYRFSFVRQRWKVAAGLLGLASAAIGIGVFLVCQLSTAPGLTVHLSIAAALFAGAGLYAAGRAIVELCGGLKFDERHLRAFVDGSLTEFTWPAVVGWQLGDWEAQACGLPALEIWTAANTRRLAIPPGRLDTTDLLLIRQLLSTYCPDREIARAVATWRA